MHWNVTADVSWPTKEKSAVSAADWVAGARLVKVAVGAVVSCQSIP